MKRFISRTELNRQRLLAPTYLLRGINGDSERQETRDALSADDVTVDGGRQSEASAARFD